MKNREWHKITRQDYFDTVFPVVMRVELPEDSFIRKLSKEKFSYWQCNIGYWGYNGNGNKAAELYATDDNVEYCRIDDSENDGWQKVDIGEEVEIFIDYLIRMPLPDGHAMKKAYNTAYRYHIFRMPAGGWEYADVTHNLLENAEYIKLKDWL